MLASVSAGAVALEAEVCMVLPQWNACAAVIRTQVLLFTRTPTHCVDTHTHRVTVLNTIGRQRLRSASGPPTSDIHCWTRAFAVHRPMVWNSLPDDLRAQQD